MKKFFLPKIKSNEQIKLSRDEAIELYKELETIVVSLHQIGSYYGPMLDTNEIIRREYERETTRFIDEWKITQKLSRLRRIISEKFNDTPLDDQMDDLERVTQGLKFWGKPGDNPKCK